MIRFWSCSEPSNLPGDRSNRRCIHILWKCDLFLSPFPPSNPALTLSTFFFAGHIKENEQRTTSKSWGRLVCLRLWLLPVETLNRGYATIHTLCKVSCCVQLTSVCSINDSKVCLTSWWCNHNCSFPLWTINTFSDTKMFCENVSLSYETSLFVRSSDPVAMTVKNMADFVFIHCLPSRWRT